MTASKPTPPAVQAGLPLRLWQRWRGMAKTTRLLLAARFWRSLAQGALVVDLSLYLHAIGWTGVAIGAVLTVSGLFGAVLSLWVGVVSDRHSRKPFLVAYEALTCLCAIVAMATANPWLLAPAIVLAGFGRGANGAAGPFSPAEQAWLAEAVEFKNRGMIYSLNTAFGFGGMALGSLAAALPALWRSELGADSFRMLFILVLLGNVINLILILHTPEERRAFAPARHPPRPAAGRDRAAPPPAPLATAADRADAETRRLENRFLGQLIALNSLNGLAVGLTGPLIAFWFAMRFGVTAAAIGPTLAVTFIFTAAAALVTGVFTHRLGLVKTVIWGRSAGVFFLFLMPLMPIYLLAAAFYVLRSVVSRGTVGARQALIVSAVRDERRGLAVSLNIISMMVPMAIGPTLAGALIEAHWFAAPFYFAALLQALYVFFYGRLFLPFERRLEKAAA